jgi:hypothetical protein
MSQTKGLKRNTVDKFYTKPSVVCDCLKAFTHHIKLDKNDILIEPSAGNGAFIGEMRKTGNASLFYDIEPENDDIVRQDYLTLKPETIKCAYHVIGNPPFGRQSSLAIKFIKKSCQFCYSVSFILPKSFKKDSLKKHFPPEYHLIHEDDLPEKSFLMNGEEHDVPCVFQIWEKKNMLRHVIPKLTPTNFTFVKKDANPDISFRRVGVNAGTVSRDIDNKSEQSHYFIKFEDGFLTDSLYEKIANIIYDCSSNTVGPKSISKQELIKEFKVVF